MEELNNSWSKISQQMYQQSQQENQQNQQNDKQSDKTDDSNNVQDADYEVVDDDKK